MTSLGYYQGIRKKAGASVVYAIPFLRIEGLELIKEKFHFPVTRYISDTSQMARGIHMSNSSGIKKMIFTIE